MSSAPQPSLNERDRFLEERLFDVIRKCWEDDTWVDLLKKCTNVSVEALSLEVRMLSASGVITSIAGPSKCASEYKGNNAAVATSLVSRVLTVLPMGAHDVFLSRVEEYAEAIRRIGPSGLAGWELGKAFGKNCGAMDHELEVNLIAPQCIMFASGYASDVVAMFDSSSIQEIKQVFALIDEEQRSEAQRRGCAMIPVLLALTVVGVCVL